MRTQKKFIILALSFIFAATSLFSHPFKEEFNELSKSAKVNADGTPLSNDNLADHSLATIQTKISAERYHEALSEIQKLTRLAPNSSAAGAKLSEKILRVMTEKIKKENERKKTFFTEFGKAMAKATKTSDIDIWLSKIQDEIKKDKKSNDQRTYVWNPSSIYFPHTDYYSSFWLTNAHYQRATALTMNYGTEASYALEIASNWQDYLHKKSLKQKDSAHAHLELIAARTVSFTYIPRSEVLKLISANLTKE